MYANGANIIIFFARCRPLLAHVSPGMYPVKVSVNIILVILRNPLTRGSLGHIIPSCAPPTDLPPNPASRGGLSFCSLP
jgi:hypothetical protein